jgi:hypothetical protein
MQSPFNIAGIARTARRCFTGAPSTATDADAGPSPRQQGPAGLPVRASASAAAPQAALSLPDRLSGLPGDLLAAVTGHLSRVPSQFVRDVAALRMTSPTLSRRLDQDVRLMSIYGLLQPLVQAAERCMDRLTHTHPDSYAVMLGLFAPRQFDRLVEAAGSASDPEMKAAAIRALTEHGLRYLVPAQRTAFIATVLRLPDDNHWRGQALRESMAHLSESERRDMVLGAIERDHPADLLPQWPHLEPDLRTLLFNSILAGHDPWELAWLAREFARLDPVRRGTLFNAIVELPPDAGAIQPVIDLLDQWALLDEGQRNTLFDTAIGLARKMPGEARWVVGHLGPAIGSVAHDRRKALVGLVESLPAGQAVPAIAGMAAGLPHLEEDDRNRLVAIAEGALSAPRSDHQVLTCIEELAPALAVLSPPQQARLVAAAVSLQAAAYRNTAVVSLLAGWANLREKERAALLDAALDMIERGTTPAVCRAIAAIEPLDEGRRARLLAVARRPYDPALRHAPPQYGAIIVLAGNLPSLPRADQLELVAALARIMGDSWQGWDPGRRADVLAAMAAGVDKLFSAEART